MLFPTVEFAIFFLVVFLGSWALRPWPTVNKVLLLAASYFFYGWWDWRFMLLLLICTTVNYVLALWMELEAADKRRRLVLYLSIAFNLGILGYFKYSGFFLSSLSDLLTTLGFQRDMKIMEVLLPVGVSFYTFQGISYVVDVYRKEIEAVKSPVDMLLFKSFFPQLVAGPIVRASEFLPQLAKPVDAENIKATRAFLLIALGLFKKIVIAHYLAVELVNPVFESPSTYSTLDLLFGVYGYAVQIYCDFSAYSDIAIGVALLFGYEFPRNFNQPYRALSIQDFWRRWHMSLSRFLKDYLYIPLGGSRGSNLKTYRNLFLTMVLGGLWHGAAWNFVIWGILHGGGLCMERFVKERGYSLPLNAVGKTLRVFLVFHFVCLTWIFFNADTFGIAVEYITTTVKGGASAHVLTPFSLALLCLGFLGQFFPEDLVDRLERGIARVPLVAQATALAMVVMVIGAIGPGTLAPFIYFKF